MYLSICSNNRISLSRVKCISVPVGHFSSGLLYQKHPCRIIPRIQIYLEISALSATSCICQFQCGRTQSSDILRVFIDFEKPCEVFFRQLSFSSADTDNGFRELSGRGNVYGLTVQETAFAFDGMEKLVMKRVIDNAHDNLFW